MAEPLTFPFAALGSPEHHGNLPRQADLVVIGGGVAGVTTALYAARRGLKVVLCEKGRIAAEQSGRNWGWIRQQGRDPAELPPTMEANQLWQDLARDTNEDFGLTRCGVTYLARRQKDLAAFEDWMPHAAAHGLDTRLLSRSEVEEMFPGAGWIGGMTTPSDMRAEPWLAVPALARLAAREGVALREHCAVRSLETHAGAVSGVVTEAGMIRTPAVALCAGAWSRLFLARHGLDLPQLSVRASVGATQPLPQVHEGGAVDDRLAFRRRTDGGYTLAPAGFHELFVGPDALRSVRAYIPTLLEDPTGTRLRMASPPGWPDGWGTARSWAADEVSPFEKMRILNPAPNVARLDRLRRDFAAAFPQLGPVRFAARWAGLIDVMPDVVPVIDALPRGGLFLATGLSGHGFGIGPAVGRILADMICGTKPGHDLTRFRYDRFRAGAPITIGPSF